MVCEISELGLSLFSAVIKYKYHDILQNERAEEFVDATKYYFDDFKCDTSLEHHLNCAEFIAFWRKVLDIFFQLDKDGGSFHFMRRGPLFVGGDVGVMEVVRFLNKNAERSVICRRRVIL